MKKEDIVTGIFGWKHFYVDGEPLLDVLDRVQRQIEAGEYAAPSLRIQRLIEVIEDFERELNEEN